jgi:putative sterol carrier protein
MDIQEMTQAFRARMGDDSGLHATVKFDCGDDGVIYLDGRSAPNQVHNESLDADCTVTISRANLEALMTRQMDPAMGFMMGKFKVSGDMSVALKLQKVM